MKNKIFIISFVSTITFIAAALLLKLTGLIPNWGAWYSSDMNYRLQTEAFLRGEVALSQRPYGHLFDWAWGNGLQQVWGLGPPALRLPFDVVARLLGYPSFPDRIVLLLFFAVTLALFLLNHFVQKKDSSFSKKSQPRLWIWLTFAFLLFFPLNFISILQSRMHVVEEAVVWSSCWTFLLLGIFIYFLKSASQRSFFILCALSGLAGFFRPTALAYGFVFSLVAAGAAKFWFKMHWNKILFGSIIFCAGCLSLAGSNQIRFGAPLEFGHSINFSFPQNDFALKFDYPYRHESLSLAAHELAGALFENKNLNYLDFYRQNIFTTQSPSFRFREFYFQTFDWITAILLFFGWTLALGFNLWDSRQNHFRFGIPIASLMSFSTLFLFYLWTPSLASRYLVDFSVAVSMGIGSLLFQMEFLAQKLSFKGAKLLLMISATMLFGWNAWELTRAGPFYNGDDRVLTENHLASRLKSFSYDGPRLPDTFLCGDKFNYNLRAFGSGWNVDQNCMVSPMTSIFINSSPCVTFLLSELSNQPTDTKDIAVKMGLEKLSLVSKTLQDDKQKLRFCRQSEKPLKMSTQALFIKWVKPELLSLKLRPIRLLGISTRDDAL